MSDLTVSLVQLNIHWMEPEKNFSRIEAHLKEAKHSDLIVLPEMFNTGFCIKEPQMAETENGAAVQFMKQISAQYNAGVCASVMIKDGDKIVNRFILVEGDEILFRYDKIHLFALSSEDQHFTPGNKIGTFDYKGFKIKPIICYDLRFPYVSYNRENYDVLLVVANWPNMRINHWEALLEARAIENQAFIVAVNRVGVDPFGVHYPGHSQALSASGKSMLHFTGDTVKSVVLHKSDLEEVRKSIPFLKDQVNLN
ncbi:nitrilase family protein [bacterium]|nr:nitrilase family protein [bacterium]